MKYFYQIMLTFVVLPAWASDDVSWQISMGLGGSVNKNENLTIKQDIGSDIDFQAKFHSRPFTTPFYYGMRVGRVKGDTAWELEHIHQKLYIDELPKQVQHFEITDGYNLFYLNYAKQLKQDIKIRMGGGVVVAHPQITVNGVETYQKGGGMIPKIWDKSSGYQWAGVSAQASIEKSFVIHDKLSISAEAKITHSQADIDLVNGSVKVPNTAFHGLVWLNYQF